MLFGYCITLDDNWPESIVYRCSLILIILGDYSHNLLCINFLVSTGI